MQLIAYLLAFQKKLANSVARFLIALWSRQTGKGFTTSFIASRGAMTEPRSKWLIVAPTERQSLETLDKCKDWIKAANLSAAESEEEFDALEKGAKVKAKIIELPNGSKIYALPGKPASLRGFTGYLILDEFAFFEDEDAVWRAVFAVITNPMASIKRIIITSTPNGQGDRFHKLVEENLLAPNPKRRVKWEVQKTTIHEAAKEWEAAGKLGTVVDETTGEERPKTAEEYVEEIREAFDCPEAWPQEYECEFLDASANLLSFDMITAAESVEATEHGFDPNEEGEFYGGFDFGGISDPSIFWFAKKVVERGPDGKPVEKLVTRDVMHIKGLDTGEQLDAVRTRIDKCVRVCVDYTGPGRGFGDIAANGLPGHGLRRLGRVRPRPEEVPLRQDREGDVLGAVEARALHAVPALLREGLHVHHPARRLDPPGLPLDADAAERQRVQVLGAAHVERPLRRLLRRRALPQGRKLRRWDVDLRAGCGRTRLRRGRVARDARRLYI